MNEPPKLVQRSISLERLFQEHGKTCLELKLTVEQLENARVAIESLQKALTETQEKLALAEQRLSADSRDAERPEAIGTN